MPIQSVGTPSELPLVSPNSEIVPPFPNENGNDKVQMKKQLGLLEGVSIILGIIFGSGKLFIYLPIDWRHIKYLSQFSNIYSFYFCYFG